MFTFYDVSEAGLASVIKHKTEEDATQLVPSVTASSNHWKTKEVLGKVFCKLSQKCRFPGRDSNREL